MPLGRGSKPQTPSASLALGPGPVQSRTLSTVGLQQCKGCVDVRAREGACGAVADRFFLLSSHGQPSPEHLGSPSREGVPPTPHQTGATPLLHQIRNSRSHSSDWASLPPPATWRSRPATCSSVAPAFIFSTRVGKPRLPLPTWSPLGPSGAVAPCLPHQTGNASVSPSKLPCKALQVLYPSMQGTTPTLQRRKLRQRAVWQHSPVELQMLLFPRCSFSTPAF